MPERLSDRLRRVLLLLPLALAACGSEGGAPLALTVERGGIAAIEQALAAQRGHACLLNFWATWCAPCVAELPDLLAVAREHAGRGARVLGVSYDLMVPGVEPEEGVHRVRAFLEQRGLALPTVVYEAPDEEAINARFDLPGGVPVTLAFDREGKLVGRHQGEATRAEFEQLLRTALGP